MNAERPLVGLQSPPNGLLGDALAGLGNTLGGCEGWADPWVPASGGKPSQECLQGLPTDLHSSPFLSLRSWNPERAAGDAGELFSIPCN